MNVFVLVFGIVVAVVVGVGLVFVGVGIASKAALKAIAGPLRERVEANVPSSEVVHVDLGANFFGLASKGAVQARGNGALVLTPRAIRFFQLVPAREFVVPLDDVREVTLVRSHLGKSVGSRLLKVSFVAGGADDAIAWFVPDPDAWVEAIASARGPANPAPQQQGGVAP